MHSTVRAIVDLNTSYGSVSRKQRSGNIRIGLNQDSFMTLSNTVDYNGASVLASG